MTTGMAIWLKIIGAVILAACLVAFWLDFFC